MPLVNLSITYVYDFHADEKPIEYNVGFTVTELGCAAPQILKCAWEEIVVFLSLARISDQSAISGNPAYECCRNGSFT